MQSPLHTDIERREGLKRYIYAFIRLNHAISLTYHDGGAIVYRSVTPLRVWIHGILVFCQGEQIRYSVARVDTRDPNRPIILPRIHSCPVNRRAPGGILPSILNQSRIMETKQPQANITVGLGDRSYAITVEPGVIDQVGEYAQSLGFHSPLAIISDDTVAPIYGERVKTSLKKAGFDAEVITFPAGETNKHLETVSHLYDEMVKLRPERDGGVIALGGGVAGDIAGFVAATYLRGLRFIQVPTTLLAQVDASVGGKVGVDHAGGKNLIGAFHQPHAVLIDPLSLKTLDQRQIRAGLAEVIKHGVIADSTLFGRIETVLDALLEVDVDVYGEIIPWNCRIKAKVVEQDERESGIRAILNFGHTIGHAIEALTGYETYLHGEAVAIGMIAESLLGEKLGVTPPDATQAMQRLIKRAGFPIDKPKITANALIESMFRDKKVKAGKLRFIFPESIGTVRIETVDDLNLIKQVWNSFL